MIFRGYTKIWIARFLFETYSKNHLLCHILFHISYTNLIWDQNVNALIRIVILQKKALRIRNFQSRDSHSSPVFKSNHVLKLEDKLLIENILFINKSFNKFLFPIFKSWFTFCSDIHSYQTVSSTAENIFKPSFYNWFLWKKFDHYRSH